AVERGADYLRRHLRNPGAVPPGEAAGISASHRLGRLSLAGLALLESGVPADDPVLVQAVKGVRAGAEAETQTYDLALAVMFLDRYGDKADSPLIRALGERLLTGQGVSGGWGYHCKHAAMVAQAEDNSNTQFAVLGLWVARKHGVSVRRAFTLISLRFRQTQNRQDGGWTYRSLTAEGGALRPEGGSRATMTCAGLLALAAVHGLAAELQEEGKIEREADPSKDLNIRGGLTALGNFLARAQLRQGADPRFGPGPFAPGGDLATNHYFLWSLERVGVVYGLDKVGNTDWYRWGAASLLRRQLQDGSWTGSGQGEDGLVATSFALLFLTKSNLFSDMSGKFKERFGRSELRSGGPSAVGPGKVPLPKLVPDAAAADRAAWEAEAQKLTDELSAAPASEFRERLGRLRDGKGGVNTEALARAIPKLLGPQQEEARAALARRLERMTAATLRRMLKDPNAEVRRAAATACGAKKDRGHVPDLIEALADRDGAVVAAARGALKELTGQDYGPGPDASPAERAGAIAEWQNWWRRNSGG
ncbi:MAG TPA: HEAT repeat domain-containing protein, partial [Gemmataceae bacterium]